MAATEAGRSLQGNRTRARPAVSVAIPLTYTQRRSHKAGAADKNNVTTATTECTPSPPTRSLATTGPTTSTTSTSNGTYIPSLEDRNHIPDEIKEPLSSKDIREPHQSTTENIATADGGVAQNNITAVAIPALQDIHNVTPIADRKHSQLLKEAEHKEPAPLSSDDKSQTVMATHSALPIAVHNQIWGNPATVNYTTVEQQLNPSHKSNIDDSPRAAATRFMDTPLNPEDGLSAQQAATVKNEPTPSQAQDSHRNGPTPALVRGEVLNKPNVGISQIGAPNLKATDLATATIKALQELSQAQRAAATTAAAAHTAPMNGILAMPQRPVTTEESSQRPKISAAYVKATPLVPQRHVQVDGRAGMTSPEGVGFAAHSGNHNSAGLRQGSPALLSLRSETERRQRMHQPHPSQGSMNFGSYPGSVHSSPAPPVTTGGYPYGPCPLPPKPMHPVMNAFPAFPPGLGYSPQPTPQIMHSPGLNNFARRHHPQSFGPSPTGTPGIEKYQQFQHSPAAHSLHTQTPPMHAQQPYMPGFGQVPSPSMMNGSGAHPQNTTLHSFPGDLFGGPPMQPPEAGDAHDGLLDYIQMQFNDPTHADFILEVRFPAKDDIQPLPLQVPGHSLLFAHSPYLRQLMAAGFNEVIYKGIPSRFITLDLDDGFVRPDSVWIALQRLYGGALLTRETLPDPSSPRSIETDATMETEKFDLALGYAAAGHILQMEPIVHRGMQVACHYLDWNTLLKALDFADAVLDPEVTAGVIISDGVRIARKYGPASELLVSATLGFIIGRFPAKFELDTSVADPQGIRRLPKPDTFEKHHQKLSEMKFGEFSLDDDAADVDAEETQPTCQTTTQTILSSVLLNLPFPLLKYVLESQNLGAITEAPSTAQRLQIMTEVIKERERRRAQAAKNWQHKPLNASQLMAQSTETQKEKTLWWLESVVKRVEGAELVRVLMRTPFGHELPA